jgi:hypothetical protein
LKVPPWKKSWAVGEKRFDIHLVPSKLKLDRAPDFSLFHLQNFKLEKSVSYDVGEMKTRRRPRKARWTVTLLQIRNLVVQKGLVRQKQVLNALKHYEHHSCFKPHFIGVITSFFLFACIYEDLFLGRAM